MGRLKGPRKTIDFLQGVYLKKKKKEEEKEKKRKKVSFFLYGQKNKII